MNNKKYFYFQDLYNFPSGFQGTNEPLFKMFYSDPMSFKLWHALSDNQERMNTFNRMIQLYKNNEILDKRHEWELFWQFNDFVWTNLKEAFGLYWQEKDVLQVLAEHAKKDDFDDPEMNIGMKNIAVNYKNSDNKMPFILMTRSMLDHYKLRGNISDLAKNIELFNKETFKDLNKFLYERKANPDGKYVINGLDKIQDITRCVSLYVLIDGAEDNNNQVLIKQGESLDMLLAKPNMETNDYLQKIEIRQVFYSDYEETGNCFTDINNWCTYLILNGGYVIKIKMYLFYFSVMTGLRKTILHW